MRILISHIFCALLFFVNLTPQAYCVTAKGLVISLPSNVEKVKKSAIPKQISNLTEISYDARTCAINDVAYFLWDDNAPVYDTDDEEISSSKDEDKVLKAYKGMDGLPCTKKTISTIDHVIHLKKIHCSMNHVGIM